MKKTRRILIFGMVTVVSVSGFLMALKNAGKVKASDDSDNNPITLNNTTEYQKYVQEKTEYHKETYGDKDVNPSLSSPIIVLGENYNKTKSTSGYCDNGYQLAIEELAISSNSVYEDSVTKELGGNNLIMHRGGTVAFDVDVTEPGFYNIYISYYTISGFRSNIDRTLTINGEYPFPDCENFTFTRIWKDNAETQVKGGETATYNVQEKTEDGGNYLYQKIWKQDTNGNELKPQQVEILGSKVVSPFRDSMGYETEPFCFYLEPGTSTIELNYTKEYFVIDALELRSVEKAKSYSEYYDALISEHGSIEANKVNGFARIEAESSSTKSSPTLYPITDRSSAATTPFSITKTLLNTIGGDNWKVLGDWIAWEFEVPESGYYEISMRAKQNVVRGMFSTRSVSLATVENGHYSEYETLFDELGDIQVPYSYNWSNFTFGNDNPYLFYFEAGKTYSLKMEVTLGDYAPLIARLQNMIDELSAIYRQIISYTTVSPDASRDYELTTKFPYLFYGLDEQGKYTVEDQGEFYKIIEELKTISKEIEDISGGKSDKTGVIDSVTVIIEKMVRKNPNKSIPTRLNTYSSNVSSLGSLLNELREAPLTIDYLEVHSPSVELPKAKAGFFKNLWTSIASFFASFFIDYSSISETGDETQSDMTIEVWMTLGRDQANVVRNLIDTSFTGEEGYAVEHYGKNINVDLKLTGGDVLLKATLAGIGPDVALNVDSSLPVNYGLRGAVLDLSLFDDFWDTVYAIPDGSENYDDNYENIYMASSLRQFTFSKLEVLDDSIFNSEKYSSEQLKSYTDKMVTIKKKQVKNTEIYALPEKQIFLMMFVRDDVMAELGLDTMIPDTWDDMIDLVAELQARQLQFYLPVNEEGASALNPIFVSQLYQKGGKLYESNNMESGFKTEEAMSTFQYWSELYTNYSFPTSASFINRFRTGEMPIGISYYEMYNTLSVFAPELKGKWSFHLIPGTERVASDGTTYIDHTATASGSGAVLMRKEVTDNDGNINEVGKAAWTFLKWWTSANTQSQFGSEMEGILGSAARHTTANVKALQSLAWPAADLKILMNQWAQVHEMPQIAGSYITGREIENAYREVINNLVNARETLYEYAQKIDTEINRKRNEFELPLLEDED